MAKLEQALLLKLGNNYNGNFYSQDTIQVSQQKMPAKKRFLWIKAIWATSHEGIKATLFLATLQIIAHTSAYLYFDIYKSNYGFFNLICNIALVSIVGGIVIPFVIFGAAALFGAGIINLSEEIKKYYYKVKEEKQKLES